MKNIYIKQLRFAMAVSVASSISKAAQLCHVTQPTLSNAMNQVEEEFGNMIFERNSISVTLTPFGKYILPMIERVISNIEDIDVASWEWNDASHHVIKLGLSPVADLQQLQKMLAPFRKEYPRCGILL